MKEQQQFSAEELKQRTEFLISIYPDMFEVEHVEKLLMEYSFEDVMKRLDEFSFQQEVNEIQEEINQLKEYDGDEENKEGEFDPSFAFQSQWENQDDLTDDLILKYYAIYKEAALKNYGKGKE